jgi:excisionase family DNA binding protein
MELLTTNDVAARLGISRSRVNLLIKQERIKATLFGKAWMIEAREVAAFQRLPRGWTKGKPRK